MARERPVPASRFLQFSISSNITILVVLEHALVDASRPRGEGEPVPRARASRARADPRAAARRRALGRRAAGRARARLGRDVAAPRGAAADRARRVAARGDERLLPRRRRARVRPARGGPRDRQRAGSREQQSILRRARVASDGAAARRRPRRGRRRRRCSRACRRTFAPGSACRPRVRRCRRSPGSGRSLPATTLGAAFTSAFDAALRRRRAERRSSSATLGLDRGAGARLRARATSSRPARGGRSALLDRPRSCSRSRCVLCARDPLTFLAGWELMTLAAGGGDPRRARADDRSRRTVFIYVAVTHLGGAGTWIAILLLAHAGAIGGPTAIARGLGPADRDRARRARRHGDEGRA